MTLRPSNLPKLAICACFEPNADAGSLALLSPLVQGGQTLSNIIAQLQVLYHLAPGSGSIDRADTQVQFSNSTTVAAFFLTNAPAIVLSHPRQQ